MKRKYSFLLTSILLVGALISSCKKYPDGPSFSLRKPEGRICEKWHMVHSFVNGNETTITNNFSYAYWWFLGSDFFINDTSVRGVKGTWEFSNGKKNILVTLPSLGNKLDYEIRKLTNKALWLRYHTDTSTNEFRFEKLVDFR